MGNRDISRNFEALMIYDCDIPLRPVQLVLALIVKLS